MMLDTNQIICGDNRKALTGIEPETFNCSISSPPYWSLRDYGLEALDWGDWKGCLGLEPTPELFIKHLCDIYDQVKRAMRKDGTVWVNLGDSYSCTPNARKAIDIKRLGTDDRTFRDKPFSSAGATQPKSLVGIPEMFVLEMQRRGWIRRATIIWVKGLSFCENYDGSCMPDSAKDRPNKNGFEYIYLFTKSKRYWFEMQYEEASDNTHDRGTKLSPPKEGVVSFKDFTKYCPEKNLQIGRQFRNVWLVEEKDEYPPMKDVWLINPQPCKEAHFATFPEKLVEICLRAGCPEFVCTKCGKAREKVYEQGKLHKLRGDSQCSQKDKNNKGKTLAGGYQDYGWTPGIRDVNFKGYTDCGCNADWRSGLVLDMFRWLWNCWGSSCKNAA